MPPAHHYMSRRRLLGTTAGVGGATLLAACGSSESSTSAGTGTDKVAKTVTWCTTESYCPPAVIDQAKKDLGIEIKPQYVASPEEVIAKLRAGNSGISLSQAPSVYGKTFYEAKIAQPLDVDKLPNYDSVMSQFKGTDGLDTFSGDPYLIPSIWGTDSIAYRTDLVPGPITSIKALWDSQYSGKIGMIAGNVEMVTVAGIYIGAGNVTSMTDAELADAQQALMDQKSLVRSYWTDQGILEANFASKEYGLAWAWVTVMGLADKGVPMQWADLEEGVISWWDGNVITQGQGASDEEINAAYKLLDWLSGDWYGVYQAENNGYRSTSQQAADALESDNNELWQSLSLGDSGALLDNAHFLAQVDRPDEYAKVLAAVNAT